MPNPYGQIVSTEHSAGLSVRQFYVRVFLLNEQFWNKEWWNCRSDVEIMTLVQTAFPSRTWSKGLVRVKQWRAGYNRGVLTPRKPKIVSHRYRVLAEPAWSCTEQFRGSRVWRKKFPEDYEDNMRLQVADVMVRLLSQW